MAADPRDTRPNGQHTAGPAALVLTATVARRYYLEGATKSRGASGRAWTAAADRTAT
jgi:hypothetical protein